MRGGVCVRSCLLVLAILVGVTGCASWQEAAVVLEDMAAGDGPSTLKQKTAPPIRQTIRYAVEGREYIADIHRPTHGAKASIILVPGLVPQGKNDPRLVAMARTLARADFRVLVPELPGIRSLSVHRGHVESIRDAMIHARRSGALPAEAPLGLMAFSYAAGPAFLAALEPGEAKKVDFILAVGGYHDLEAVLQYFTTGYYQAGDRWRYQPPRPAAKWSFVLANLDRIESPADRSLLRSIALRRMTDPDAVIHHLAGQLGPGGGAVYRLVTNDDPAATPTLINELPAPIRDEIRALDLAGKSLAGIGASVILVHGRQDDVIPYTQSVELAERLPEGRTHLFLVDGLMHVDLEPDWKDRIALWRAVRLLLAERDWRDDGKR